MHLIIVFNRYLNRISQHLLFTNRICHSLKHLCIKKYKYISGYVYIIRRGEKHYDEEKYCTIFYKGVFEHVITFS